MTATVANLDGGCTTEEVPKAVPITTFPVRSTPIIHPSADAPLCENCQQLALPFFDPSCPGCCEILQNPSTTIPELFAIIRQWVPQTQQNIETLVNEILKRGAHINDRDGLTDMTLLHYACKAGASGVGDVTIATRTVGLLLDKGADLNLRCRWTDMAAIHYAAYFDVAPVLELLLKANDYKDINSPCREFDGGTPLHIAATNLCLEAAQTLLERGADVLLQDDLGRIPLECVPKVFSTDPVPDLGEVVTTLRQLLQEATASCPTVDATTCPSPTKGRVLLESLGLCIGDQVIVGGAKVGILKFCGATHFAPGIWAGVELEEPSGKNDGSVKDVCYFRCQPNHGIFAPINKVMKYDEFLLMQSRSSPTNLLTRSINHPKIDISHVTPKVETGLKSRQLTFCLEPKDVNVGDRVVITGQRKGTVRFIGETQFAPGVWYGIELEKPVGKNDGSMNGVQYFTCKPNHGIFSSLSRIKRVLKSKEDESDQESSDMSISLSRSSTEGDTRTASPSSPIRNFASKKQHNKPPKPKTSPQPTDSSPYAKKGCWLTLGMNVFVNNEIAIVRYIGPVDFADGTWLGVELRTAKGKNDGSVQGKRYFTCKPNHGLLVRPRRVTVRGINGAKLINEDQQHE